MHGAQKITSDLCPPAKDEIRLQFLTISDAASAPPINEEGQMPYMEVISKMITADTTFNELLSMPQVSGFRPFLLSNCRIPDMDWSFRRMNEHFYDWVADSIVFGLNRLLTLISQGVRTDYDIYTEEEMAADPEKKGTKLFWFPADRSADGPAPFVMVCPGGGYGAVCTLKEGFTTAAWLNEMGISAFILSYRVRPMTPGSNEKKKGIMPLPLDDMARAITFIGANPERFHADTGNYAVAGYSSGGHLAGAWATGTIGAASYGLEAPKAVFLGYPALDTTVYRSMNGRNMLLEGLIGSDYAESDVMKYNVNAHIDSNYPATYVWHCKDDNIVPVETSVNMDKELTKHGVPHIYREVLHGGHGFGTGEYSEARGWLIEAVDLWQANS